MRIEILRKIEDIHDLSDEWNALLGNSASHVPFLTPEFIAAWWGHLGGGEWEQGELYIIVVRNDEGKLIGIAPLFLTQDTQSETTLMFVGSHEIADFLDFVVRPADLELFLQALFEHLSGPPAPSWKYVDLYNLLDLSPTLAALEAAVQAQGWTYRQEKIQPAPHIQLPQDWETYLAGLNKKHLQ